jgi:hypothetical protein
VLILPGPAAKAEFLPLLFLVLVFGTVDARIDGRLSCSGLIFACTAGDTRGLTGVGLVLTDLAGVGCTGRDGAGWGEQCGGWVGSVNRKSRMFKGNIVNTMIQTPPPLSHTRARVPGLRAISPGQPQHIASSQF